jgi:hypothetical protein
MPTHEVYAQAYFAAGVSTYSSAIFNSSEHRRYQGCQVAVIIRRFHDKI